MTPFRRHDDNERRKVHDADLRVNGSISERLQRERDVLSEEENMHKDRMVAIAGFRKTEIIPIGKLRQVLDESDSESEPLSESEETASGHDPQQVHVDETDRLDNSIHWSDGHEQSQPVDTSVEEDLDADVEDLDVDDDYSRNTNPEDASMDRYDTIDQSIDAEEIR